MSLADLVFFFLEKGFFFSPASIADLVKFFYKRYFFTWSIYSTYIYGLFKLGAYPLKQPNLKFTSIKI